MFGLHPDGVVLSLDKLTHLLPGQHAAARRLRDLPDHYVSGKRAADSGQQKTLTTDHRTSAAAFNRVVLEVSFTALNRLAALRLREERGLVVECARKVTASAGFQMFERISGGTFVGRYDTYRVFLECLFDELALDLALLFDRRMPQSTVFPSERCMEDVLSELNKMDLTHLCTEDETIGWVYPYFNNSFEHSGGAGPNINQGVSKLSVDSSRFNAGNGNTGSDWAEAAISAGRGSTVGSGLGGKNRTIDRRTLELILKKLGYDYTDSAYRLCPLVTQL